MNLNIPNTLTSILLLSLRSRDLNNAHPLPFTDLWGIWLSQLDQWQISLLRTLANFKVPRRVEFCPSVPRNPTGKARKHGLR